MDGQRLHTRRNNLITAYFNLGLSYRDICEALAIENGLIISERHLKRILKTLQLKRRRYTDTQEVIDFIEKQHQGSGQMHGYRWMFQKCLCNGIVCRKEDVRAILSILDPHGNEQRRKRRLLRRRYSAKGPNYLWHFDSYDKLRRYGLCINGCIDGFSRKIIWMNAYNTSNNPRVIGGYYIEAVTQLGGCPRIIRSDKGTENGHVREFQRYLRRNGTDTRAGLSSYMEGRSTANQRIEYWWAFLRRECTDFWICFFQKLVDDGDFNGSFLDVNLIQFCFLHLIQVNIPSTCITWNFTWGRSLF